MLDAAFLFGDTPQHPMHVATLQLFEPPPDAKDDYFRKLFATLSVRTDATPTFLRHPVALPGISPLLWTRDENLDLFRHLVHIALPAPGGQAQLLEVVDRLHGQPLDRNLPLWQVFLIEGLADGRFAVYCKWHHALLDGAAAQRLFARTLDAAPTSAPPRAFWQLPPANGHRPEPNSRSASRQLRTLLDAGRKVVLDRALTVPFEAPRSPFNVPIGTARRCAVLSLPRGRIEAVRRRTATTANDVILTVVAGALRGYLDERHQLPARPLVSMVPMTLRSADDHSGGNKVGATLCALGTDIADPRRRLAAISRSMADSKSVFAALPTPGGVALSGLMLSPLLIALLAGRLATLLPACNVVISKVPGTHVPRYWGDARLDALYPLSIPLTGLALNITFTTTNDRIDFGLVACPTAVPELDRLLELFEESLAELEKAAV
ncbi:wax ester/triacylglycerol synthase family O-acyltransferase [Nocardia sp. NPDC004068]|uniref:WS/DGAT/MGAT family O-acyltransferase n=1 Tax=Nocardia sp. NPDC004068 TaxID=3364303 RepID=UPI0036BEE554